MRTISNEEKAKHIATNLVFELIEPLVLSKEQRQQIEFKMYYALIEMAEWKDEQYKELKEATQTLYESARKVAQLYEPLQLALNKVFWEINIK